MEKKKIKIEIKNRWTGEVLFEYEKKDNTIKDTVVEAVKEGADLSDADLSDANLRGADLRGADLRGADIRGADIRGAYLGGAYLGGADIRGADLGGAYLGGANLRGADIRGADLGGADLGGAYLRGAYLRGADLRGAKNIPFIPLACPSDGTFIGWKKVKDGDYRFLVKLQIPAEAKRSSATGTKCRCDRALVLEITDLEDEGHKVECCVNVSYDRTEYKVGEMVYPDSFDDDRWNECSHGIHFFINKQEAIDYDV